MLLTATNNPFYIDCFASCVCRGSGASEWAVDVSYSISNVQVVVDPQIKVENGEKILKERFRVDFSQSVFIVNGAHQIWL